MILSEKTKFIIFSLRNELKLGKPLKFHQLSCYNLGTYETFCNCLQLEQVNSIKYLGLVIDSQLSWKEHVGKIKRELYISLRKFYFMKQLCNISSVLVNIYHALIGSRLSYGITCWGGTYGSTLYPVLIVQKGSCD